MRLIRPTIVLFFTLTLLTGVVYPLIVTIVAQGIFPYQANGSLLGPLDGSDPRHTKVLGSRASRNPPSQAVALGSALIGQPFSSGHYFWGRPSATSPIPYDAAASTGSNLGPTNPALKEAVRGRVERLRTAHNDPVSLVPIDFVTASASGLDPHITPAAAEYQVARVAVARGMSEQEIRRLVQQHTEGRSLGILGEPRVHVLRLNLALDTIAPKKP